MRAMTSPTDTLAPSSRLTSAPAGRVYTAGISVLANVTSLPFALTSFMVARTSLPPRCLVSSTTVLERPGHLVHLRVTVRPSTKSWNFMKPATSVTTGWVCGSHVATTCPEATESPSFDGDRRAVRDLVALTLATEVVDDADFARTRYRDEVPLLVLHRLDVMEADEALVTDLDAAGSSGSRRGTTDVERTHRQLRARLTDRLRGDDADSLTDADRATACEVASVAARAHAVSRLARDRRTHRN